MSEIALVFRGQSGVALPTKDHGPLLIAAKLLGPLHVEALGEQVRRQVAALSAPPSGEVPSSVTSITNND